MHGMQALRILAAPARRQHALPCKPAPPAARPPALQAAGRPAGAPGAGHGRGAGHPAAERQRAGADAAGAGAAADRGQLRNQLLLLLAGGEASFNLCVFWSAREGAACGTWVSQAPPGLPQAACLPLAEVLHPLPLAALSTSPHHSPSGRLPRPGGRDRRLRLDQRAARGDGAQGTGAGWGGRGIGWGRMLFAARQRMAAGRRQRRGGSPAPGTPPMHSMQKLPVCAFP